MPSRRSPSWRASPGFIRTPLNDALPPEIVSDVEQATPLGRMGEFAEVAELVAWLASDAL